MRVPIYEEIKIHNFDIMSLVDALRRSRCGKGPTYIVMPTVEAQEAYHLLDGLAEALRILKISPLVPYPLYIITPHIFPEIDLPTLKSIDDLPRHFHNKVKRLTNKELDLINKSVTIAERTTNQPVTRKLQELRKKTRDHKRLYQLSQEQSFYENVLKQLLQKKEGAPS